MALKYRKALESESVKITEFCKGKGVCPPTNCFVFIAEDEGVIKGVVSVKTETFLDCLAADNGVIAHSLNNMAEGFMHAHNVQEVNCFCDERFEDLYIKVGYVTTDSRKILMRKEL